VALPLGRQTAASSADVPARPESQLQVVAK
jgi:DNA-binding NarL/FixJ family response regulator